jgi:hypothetical protein
MKHKNIIKIVLDTIMIFVLVLMYKKSSISMQFHEIGGLILLAVFIVHLVINKGFITAVSKRFFKKSLPVKVRIGYIVDLLLLLSFVLIGISGVMISKIVFSFSIGGGNEWKVVHYFCSALALILIGIHTGFHRKFIGTMYGKIKILPRKVSVISGIIIAIVFFICGCYSLSSTSFAKWITMPFSVNQVSGYQGGNQLPEHEKDLAVSSEGDSLLTGSDSEVQETIEIPVTSSNQEMGLPHGAGQSASFSGVLFTITQFLSISFVFSVLTYLFEILVSKKKRLSL